MARDPIRRASRKRKHGMTYKEFYAHALLQSLPVAYDRAKAMTSLVTPPLPEIIQETIHLADALTVVWKEAASQPPSEATF